jgi:hypothetical protein
MSVIPPASPRNGNAARYGIDEPRVVVRRMMGAQGGTSNPSGSINRLGAEASYPRAHAQKRRAVLGCVAHALRLQRAHPCGIYRGGTAFVGAGAEPRAAPWAV